MKLKPIKNHKLLNIYYNLIGLIDLAGDHYIEYYFSNYKKCWDGKWRNKEGEII